MVKTSQTAVESVSQVTGHAFCKHSVFLNLKIVLYMKSDINHSSPLFKILFVKYKVNYSTLTFTWIVIQHDGLLSWIHTSIRKVLRNFARESYIWQDSMVTFGSIVLRSTSGPGHLSFFFFLVIQCWLIQNCLRLTLVLDM